MDPEQLVAQLAELRTQNQQLRQALRQVQQQESQQQGLVQALSGLPQSRAQTVGAAVLAAASPSTSQSNLGGHERFGKASTAEEHGERVRVLGTTHRELRRERTPWSERRLDVGRGKRFGNGVGSERRNGSCDASGHCQLQRSRFGHVPEVEGRSGSLRRSKRYVAPRLGQVSKAREDRDDPMDVGGFGQWKGRTFSKGKGKNTPLALAKERAQEKKVRNHRDEQTRRKFKAGKQVINRRTARQGHSSRVKDSQILLEREMM